LITNNIYLQDIERVVSQNIEWEALAGRTMLVSGAAGMIGRFLIDAIMLRNESHMSDISVIALGRSNNGASRFRKYLDNKNFKYVPHDITKPYYLPEKTTVDYIIHAASNTHPLEYSTDPIGTITTNVLGTINLLNLASQSKVSRFILLSSVEVYGENLGDVEVFHEDYSGYINPNTLRAGYPESKRTAEALCQAYAKVFNQNYVIARLARTFGPTMHMNDSKAVSQFIKNAIHNEDIVLKSKGDQLYSYTYVGDAVWGILKLMIAGINGEAYNIAGKNSDYALRDLAYCIAGISGTKVVFETPDPVEILGYSKAKKAILSIEKIKKLGWYPIFDVKESLKRTVEILRNCENLCN